MIGKVCVFSRPMIAQHVLAGLIATALVLGVVYVRREPIQLIGVEISDKVKPGSFIDELAEVDRKRSDCESVVSAEIVDGQTVHFKLSATELPPAVNRGPTLIYRQYPVPFAAAWGPGRLIMQRTYYCWPFYSVWPFPRPVLDLPFEIIPP